MKLLTQIASLIIALIASSVAGELDVRAAYGGYWRCEAGKWLPVGEPHHPVPRKICGAVLDHAKTEAACAAVGGKWGPAGLFPKPICRTPTHDGGRPCADTDECEGFCLAPLTPKQREMLKGRRRIAIMGQCTPYVPVFGCMARVEQGYVSGLFCAD